MITGLIVSGIILASTSQIHFFTHLERLALPSSEIFCSVLEALVPQSSKRTARDIWMGAIQGFLVRAPHDCNGSSFPFLSPDVHESIRRLNQLIILRLKYLVQNR